MNHNLHFQHRTAGILMPIFSLPSPFGIGSFGKPAYNFIDFLALAKQKYWQVLPLNPTDTYNSPYASPSAFAGNSLFIDLELLIKQGLLKKSELHLDFQDTRCTSPTLSINHLSLTHNPYIDYKKIQNTHYPLYKKAFFRFTKNDNYNNFIQKNSHWLNAYIVYQSNLTGESVDYFAFLQYIFYTQWQALKAYANSKGISIIGDIPLYVAEKSVDEISNPHLFLLDKNNSPTLVAGCPPDDFSKDGQKWGNPLYNWEAHRQSGYKWWIERLAHNLLIYDAVRLDHFRGLEQFFAIPKEKTALDGSWHLGGGEHFIKTINSWFNNPPLIAEDLGHITDGVRHLLKVSNYPTMRVLNFGFNAPLGKSEHLPHNFANHTVAYSQTHDTDTICGLYNKSSAKTKADMNDYFGTKNGENIGFLGAVSILKSPANTAIIPLPDYLNLDSTARVNTPGIVGNHNWSYQHDSTHLNKELAQKIARQTILSGRV